jgi:hypothetical protein
MSDHSAKRYSGTVRVLLNMMKTAFFISLAASLFAGTATAQNFVSVSQTEAVIMGFDKASVGLTSEGFASAQTVTVFRETMEADGARLDYAVAREIFDCTNRKSRTASIAAYRIGGTYPTLTMDDPRPWQTYEPAMVNAAMALAVCDKSAADSVGSRTAEDFALRARAIFHGQ